MAECLHSRKAAAVDIPRHGFQRVHSMQHRDSLGELSCRALIRTMNRLLCPFWSPTTTCFGHVVVAVMELH